MNFNDSWKEKLKDSRQRPLLLSLVCSVSIHLVAYLLLNTWSVPQWQEAETIEVTFLENEKSHSTLTEEKDDLNNLQIVQQDKKRLNDEVDEEAKFLGRHNQRVVRETKAANHGALNNQAAGTPEVSENTQNHVEEKTKPDPKKSSVSEDLRGNLPTFAQLKPQFDWDAPQTHGENPNLNQASQQNDHLKDVETGIQTLLSTREFVYYSYYSRIKSRLQQYWEPKIKEKMETLMRKGRKIASAEGDRITQLVIVLNNKGILQKVKIIGESGVEDLDDAAIEAFRAAAPFPNPPKGIIEGDGTVKIRWDFVLEA